MQIGGFWPVRPQALDRMRRGRWLASAVIALGLAAALAGCGGDDEATPGVATIGAAGGTVTDAAGAQVVFPKDALRADVTVRIAKDSTGAPPLPAAATPAGAVYTITPHGEAFAVHAEVSIPVEITQLSDNQQLLLVTAEPGDTQWRVLSGASYANGVLRAPVMHFSFFRAIILTDVYMPSLVTTLEVYGAVSNNVGGAGIGRFAPDFEFNQESGLQYSAATLRAKLTFPSLPPAVRSGMSNLPPQRACLPSSHAHTGAAWRFLRNGTQTVAPDVTHLPIIQVADSDYPRYDNEIAYTGWSALFTGYAVPGFGAVHVYGQDTPRRGAFAPAGSTDVWASPPPGNRADNDQLMWAGSLLFNGEQHNGRLRIDVTVATDCNLLVEAVPISFQLNLASRLAAWTPYSGVFGRSSPINAPNGLTAVLPFVEEFAGTTLSIAWEYSHDLVNWEKLPVPAQYIQDNGPNDFFEDYYPYGHSYSIVIPNVQPSQAGWYRAWACSKPVEAFPPAAALPSLCVSKAPVQLVVLTEKPAVTSQPRPQIVQVGQTASFSVSTDAVVSGFDFSRGVMPDVFVQWQKRPLVEAAFGIGTWTDIAGATYFSYTTPPTTLNDTAMLYRAVVSTVLGSTPSDAALLTVVEQLAPPVVVSQPGNLNVTVGGSAMFAATVTGTAPLSYQWRHNGVNLVGANAAILTLANVSGVDGGNYDLVVSNRAGSVTSDPAVLVVSQGTPVALPPTIAAPPASITVAQGNAANFAVSVNGTGPYTYFWMKNGVQAPLPGGDAASWSIAAVSNADAATYSVRVTNGVGTVVSAAATLTVSAGAATPLAPTISTQPTTLVVMPGAAATLAIAASGSGPLVYQWFRNGTPVNGATDAVLHLSSVGMLDAGTYTVAVSNGVGSVSSNAAQLILVGAPALTAQPANVSVVEGGAATFAVTATGDGLRYLWTRNQIAIAGATAASYTTPALTLADSGAVYGAIVYNGAGLVFSQGAVLTVTAAAPATKAWGPAALIETDNVGNATRARVAMDASGNAIAVWPQADTTRTNIWANRYDAANQAWGAPTLIETDDAGDASGPQIAVLGNGDAIAVWYQDDGSSRFNIWANRYVAATNSWGTATLLEASTATARSPQVGADGNGNALVVWSEYNGLGSIWAIRYTAGSGWDAAAKRIESGSTNSAGPAEIAVGANGDAIAVWTHFDGARNNIWANRYAIATQSWGTAELIETGNAGTAGSPHVAVDANGNAVATWPYFDGARYDIMANHYNASTNTWGLATPSLTATATGSGDAPRVAFDAAGNAIVVWAQGDGGRYSIWANRYTPGVGWGGAALIETDDAGDAALPQIALDGSGNAVAVWYQFDGTRNNIVANRFTVGAGWGTAAVLETGAGTALRPHVAMNSTGNAVAVWDQHDGSQISIWASSFR